MLKLKKILIIICSTFIIVGTFNMISTANRVYAFETENVNLSSNTSTYSIIDKSQDDVVLVEGKGNSSEFENTESINSFNQIKYISNANYFLLNPKHHINDGSDNSAGSCTTVAMQMLLGYHNYYSDRRIIPQTHNNSALLDNDYGNLSYHPLINANHYIGQGMGQIGTLDGVYDGIYDNNLFADLPYVGQALNNVKAGATNFLGEVASVEVRSEITITDMEFFSETEARAEIDGGSPLILSAWVLEEEYFHVVVAYGYAQLNGEDGFFVHYGWGDSGRQVWMPSYLFAFQMRMSVNHTHNLVDTGNNVATNYRELICLECGFRTVDYLYEMQGTTLSKAKYPLTGSHIINNYINKYVEETASFSQVNICAIGDSAFANQTQLTELTMPGNLTSIGERAFLNCSSLYGNFKIPHDVTYVGNGAFAGCNNLSINSYSSNYVVSANILYNANKTKIITTGNIGSNITIEETVTEIGEYAFYNNSNIESVTIKGCPMIMSNAFVSCANLTNITLFADNVPIIAIDAFDNREYNLNVPLEMQEYYENVFEDIADMANIMPIEFQIEVVCSMTGDRLGYASAYYREQVVLDFVPTKEDYEFWGLFEGPNGDGKSYVLKSDFLDSYTHQIQCESTNQIWTEKGTGTLYVHWEKLDKYVSYDVVYINESTQSPRSVFIRSGEQTTITAPTIDGYTFDHWTIHNTNYTSASQNITVTLHRSYSTGNITIQNPDYPMQDAYFAVYYNKVQSSGGGSCVAQGTLITLADGRQVPVESLTGNERLLVWNLKTGRFDTAPILFIDSEPAKVYEIINLYFSDGTHVKVIDEHAFWDFNLNKYVYLRSDASKYIGHYFNKQVTDENGVMTWTSVQLVNVTITEEYTTAWSPVTYQHLCLYVNGMLSMPGGIEGLVNTYEVDATTMKIDQALYLQDVQTYGLFTYEEFYELYSIPEYMFEAVGGENLKVAIGKGYIGYQTIEQLIERYSEFFE